MWMRTMRKNPIQSTRLRSVRFPARSVAVSRRRLGTRRLPRQLMRIVRRFVPDQPGEHINAEAALAAALVHDVGHGPFSHAFEPLGKLAGGWLESTKLTAKR